MRQWTPRAVVTIGWYLVFVVLTFTFAAAAASEARPTRYASPFDFAHLSYLALTPLLVEPLVRRFPLARPHLLIKLLLHATAASLFSTLAGLATGFTMGIFDRLEGIQHLVNTLTWHLTPHPARFRLLAIEQLFYFSTAALFEMINSADRRREADLRAAALESELAQATLLAEQSRIPPEYLQDVFREIALTVSAEPSRAERLITKLARFLRHSLEAASRQELRRKDDLRVAASFIEVEAERLRLPIRFQSALTRDDEEELITTLSLTPQVIAMRGSLADTDLVDAVIDDDDRLYAVLRSIPERAAR